MDDLLPRSGKAEWHITYRCDLECVACNRASFLRQPHTADMTLEDAEEFCRQARALSWAPSIVLIGGEPALHQHFEAFVAIARAFATRPDQYVQVYSNAYSGRTKGRLNVVRDCYGASICCETQKPLGSVTAATAASTPGWTDDIFVSPTDFGEPLRRPCYQHASIICGVSVDHEGYAPCAMGGAIDALLGLGVRTKRLADLWDPAQMAEKTAKLCAHCGHQTAKREHVAACETRWGTRMSPTWLKAFEGRK